MYARAFTQEWITELKPNEIFVSDGNLYSLLSVSGETVLPR